MADSGKPSSKIRKQDEEDIGNNVADGKAQAALERIVGIQNDIDQLNEQASEEILKVEQKYNQLRKPHYAERAKLCSEVPEFWITTLFNHPGVSDLINEEDELVLQYLDTLSVDEYENVKSGFKILMHFKPNPYFENTTLSKEFVVDSSGDSNITGSTIQWKEGKDVTVTDKDDEEKQGRKRAFLENPSFFCWFKDYSESDVIAEYIKDEIWPNPLQYFLQGDVSVEEDNEEIEEEIDEEDDELVDLDEEEDDC